MGETTGISWTSATWNPWQGCRHASEGCRNCYMFSDKIRYGQDPKDIHRSSDATFRVPLKWQREVEGGKRGPDARLVFTCSWSDWFIEEADAWRDDGWEVIRRCPDLIFQILTKRAHRMADHLPPYWDEIRDRVWLGVSAEDQKNYDKRRPFVDADLSPVMWWSLEPLLGWINMGLRGYRHKPAWTVVGGESGHGARRCDVSWVRTLVRQCEAEDVAVYVKQMGGAFVDEPNGVAGAGLKVHPDVADRVAFRLKDPKGGNIDEFPDDLKVRQFPAPATVRSEVPS